jgi:mono/diheme cytochrome c family protein
MKDIMIDKIYLAALVGLFALLAWCSVRAWRSKKALRKWAGVCSAGLIAAMVSVVVVLMSAGLVKRSARTAAIPDLTVTATVAQIARGRAIADSFCGACHSKTGTLTGGEDIGKHFPVPVGSFVSSNLTPAGSLAHWSDGEIFRAIRNGVDANGRWLVVMSYTNAGKLSDQDIRSVIAYIRDQPAAGERTPEPPDHLSPLGLTMLGAGMLPGGKPVLTGIIKAPAKSATAQYGEYILSYQDCRECHGSDLKGGVQGQLPPVGPGLDLVKAWSLDQFISTMRTGMDPVGHQIGEAMPWQAVGKMDDEELAAIYQYLIHLPAAS